MSLAAVFADISLLQLAMVAAFALFASVVGGVAGYGTGALLPLVLVPLVGAEAVVPIIAMSSLLSNGGRAAAFRAFIDWRRTTIVLVAAIAPCMLTAYGFTKLNSAGAMLVIGTILIGSVPVRRLMLRQAAGLGDRALFASGAGYGALVGGSVGAGIVLLSLLMATGMPGAAVVATDAIISIALSLVKITVFGISGIVNAQAVALALLIGLVTFPGAFLAKALVHRLPMHVHTYILDGVVVIGGAAMVIGALR
jgi:uncharacterized membrane protein YfcA